MPRSMMKLAKRFKAFVYKQSSRASSLFRRRSTPSRHPSHLSLMDNFPEELISQVFRLATEGVSSTDLPTLLAITGTCKRWRAIGLDDGHLWAWINVTFTSLARDLSRAVAFLLRSKGYPLVIHLDLRDPSWDFDEDSHPFGWQDMEAIMRMLIVHAHRWRSLTLLTDTWSPVFTFLWYSRHVMSMPLLDTLSLSRCNMFLAGAGQTFEPVALRQPVNLFGGIRLDILRVVSFIGVHVEWDNACLQNLERFELKYIINDVAPTIAQLERLLRLSPCLKYLAIHGAVPNDVRDSDDSSVEDQILLSELNSLSLGFLIPSDATRLLSLLNIPQVKEVTLDDISAVLAPDTTHDSAPFFQFLIDNQYFRFRDLRALRLSGIQCDTQILTSFLSDLHSISTLSLSNMSNDILRSLHVFEASTQTAGPEYICQALRELHCQDADPEVLIALVRSRSGHVGLQALEQVSLEFVRQSAPDFFSPIYEQLTQLGVVVIQQTTRSSQFSATSSSYS